MTLQPLVELQIQTPVFLAAQLLNLQTQDLSFPAPFAEGGSLFVVDHVEFGQNTLLNTTPSQKLVYYNEALYGLVSQEVNGFRPQISQPITVFVVSLDDVEAHPNGAPANPVGIGATMILGLDYFMAGGGVDVLSITVDRVDVAPLPPLPPGVDPNDVKNRFLSFVQSFGGQQLPLNLANSVAGSGTNIINTGMAVSADLQRIAFRQEIGGGIEGDPSIWQAFYSGDFDDRLQDSSSQDQPFGVFESAAVLENAAVLQISNGLYEQAADQAKNPQPVYFQLVTGIGSSFSVNGGTPTITTSFSGNLNTPACSVWTDVTVVSGLSMNQPNTLTIDTNYSWNTDTTACTVLAGALGTALGIFADFIVPMGALIVEPFLFGVSGIAAVLVAKNVAAPPPFSVDNCQQVSDTHLVCTQSISVQNSPLGSVSMNTLEPQQDGVAILGNLLPIPVGNPQLVISVESDFVWQAPRISCGEISGNEVTDFRRDPQNYVSLIANASITAQGLAPIFLISASVINDPLNVFTPYLTVQGTQAPIELTVNLNYPGAQYFANPYPCQILVLTTGGARLISIPAPQPLTELTIDALAAQIAGQVLFCQKMVDQWWNVFHRYNPVWSVDPGIGENAVEHGYEVEISGLRPGETATLVGEGGQVLQTGVAQAGATLRLNAIVSPAGAGEIGIVRGRRPRWCYADGCCQCARNCRRSHRRARSDGSRARHRRCRATVPDSRRNDDPGRSCGARDRGKRTTHSARGKHYAQRALPPPGCGLSPRHAVCAGRHSQSRACFRPFQPCCSGRTLLLESGWPSRSGAGAAADAAGVWAGWLCVARFVRRSHT